MPRASKAIDAAKQLGRKVAATEGKISPAAADPADKPTKATKPTKAPKATKPTKGAKPAKPAKKGRATSKAASASKKVDTAVERPSEDVGGAGGDKFFEDQRSLLEDERVSYLAQAADLKAEADQLAQEMEPGDIQFDDESGEGGTAAVDRERDLALSAQARIEVDEIDHALAKLANGSYGLCEGCGQPIPRARLKALPHARLCVSCKSGGLSRR